MSKKIKKKLNFPKKSFLKTVAFLVFVLGLSFFFKTSTSFPKEEQPSFSEEDLKEVSGGNVLGSQNTLSPKGNFGNLINNNYPDLKLTAKSALAIDLNNETELFSQNKDLTLPPASTTKIVTALIALENYDLSKKALVPSNCVGLEGSNVGFAAGDVVTIEGLLYGMLVPSAADAACALASIEVDRTGFIKKMNEKVEELGLKDTNFSNEIGFDEGYENQVSSAHDLYILGREALKNDVFRKIVGTREADVVSISTGAVYKVKNTNELLFNLPGTTGIKTGFTDNALGCLVFSYENLKSRILIVVMGSTDRFGDTIKILDFSTKSLNSQVAEQDKQF